MEKRIAYFIMPTAVDEKTGQFIPCIAVEGEKGYHKTDFLWGTDIDIAEECAKEKNEAMGISEKEATLIVLSTMGGKILKKGVGR